jgi:hypothetical protein
MSMSKFRARSRNGWITWWDSVEERLRFSDMVVSAWIGRRKWIN